MRAHLLNSLKATMRDEKVLDDFQVGGVFANWWDTIKFDFKTITASGWQHTLIPDDYLIRAFFQDEQDALEKLADQLGDQEAHLDEAVQDVDYEPEEDEKVTATVIKRYLTDEIKALKEDGGPLLSGARDELAAFEKQLKTITKAEKAIKDTKADLKTQETRLEEKVQLKRYGLEDVTADLSARIRQVQSELAELEATKEASAKDEKARKQEVSKRKKDVEALTAQSKRAAELFKQLGGVITPEESKTLILEKHYGFISSTMLGYVDTEKAPFNSHHREPERQVSCCGSGNRTLSQQHDERTFRCFCQAQLLRLI